jgi:hypothetical protein
MLRVYRIIALLLLCLAPSAAPAEDFDSSWARAMGGTGFDYSDGIAVDSEGNVYTTGHFRNTADFDPGAGNYNLTSAGEDDIFVQKLDSSGELVWAHSHGGARGDIGIDIAVDGSGSVYTTGSYEGTVDFDPGAGTFNLTSARQHDAYVQKLDASGNLLWVRSMGSTDHASGFAIAVDGEGNVYTTGSFQGSLYSDSDGGTVTLTSTGSSNIFVQKLDSSGELVWERNMGGPEGDGGVGIAVDDTGSVYAAGSFKGTADLDPGLEFYNVTSREQRNTFVLKLDVSGSFVWARSLSSRDYNSPSDIAVDNAGNVYTAGYFYGNVDLYPETGILNLGRATESDSFMLKLDTSGNLAWARRTGGRLFESARAIALDYAGNVYTTGSFQSTVDFDPGRDIFYLSSAGSTDYYLQKLDASGNFVWARRMGGPEQDMGSGIFVDSAENIYTTGTFSSTAAFDLDVSTSNLISAGETDIFVHKIRQDFTPPNVEAIVPNTVGPTNTTRVDFTVTFDEEVQNFDAADIVINHGVTTSTDASISGGPYVYTVTISGITGDGSFTLVVNTASDVQDFAGNPLATSVTSAEVAIDNTAPTVSIGGPSGSPVNSSGTVAYPVTVDGASSINLTSGDVTINHIGTAGGSVVVVDGMSEAPTVQVTGVTGDGSYTISIAAGIATDAAGNTSLAAGPSAAIIVDNTAPTVIIGAPMGAPVNSGGTASYPVAVSGSGNINLTSGAVTINHSGTAGGSVVVLDRVTVTPTVQVSGVTGDGNYTISIAAGIATDAVGNVSLAAGPSSGAVSVDNTPPVFTNLVANPSEASEGDTVSIGFDSSKPIAGDPNVTVNGNPATRTAKAGFAFDYTVLAGDALGAATIEISGVDGAGNVGTLSDGTALTIADGEGEGAVEGAPDGEGEGSVEAEGEGVGDGEGEGALEGESEGNIEGQGEGDGEGENPPVGCGGCNANGAPMEKSLGDWLAVFLGLAVLLGVHVSLRSRQEA